MSRNSYIMAAGMVIALSCKSPSNEEIAQMDLSQPVCTMTPLSDEELPIFILASVLENEANAPPELTGSANTFEKTISELKSIDSAKIAALTGRLWEPGRTITVHFLNGSPVAKSHFREIAKEWTEVTTLTFVFVEQADADIRVKFRPGDSGSLIGTESLSRKEGPTMLIGSYPPNADESMARSVVLHELGHALGLVHEHQSPNAQIPWNTEAVYAYYYDKHRWDRPYVDKHIFQKYAANESQFTVFDPTSIMIYPIPEEFTIGGFSVKWNQTLSKMDKEFVRSKYGRTNESPNP